MLLKLSKIKFFYLIIILWTIASIITFYATNLVLEGVLQKDCPIEMFFLRLTPGLTFLFVALDFILAIFFFLRLYLHPTHEKSMLRTYGIILMAFSILAIIFNIISGNVLYNSFIINRPWAGFHVIMLVFHISMLVLGGLMIFYFPRLIKDSDIILHKINSKYVFKTIGIALIFFISLNRLGALILAPVYIQWRTLPLTYPAYCALVLPSAILLVDLIYMFGFLDKKVKTGIIISSIILTFSFIFFIQILYRATTNQLFVQVCSPFNPLGRLTVFPIDAILESVISLGLVMVTLANSIVFKRLADLSELPYQVRTKNRLIKYQIKRIKGKNKKNTNTFIKNN